jgi:hypothetical protein
MMNVFRAFDERLGARTSAVFGAAAAVTAVCRGTEARHARQGDRSGSESEDQFSTIHGLGGCIGRFHNQRFAVLTCSMADAPALATSSSCAALLAPLTPMAPTT